MADYVTEATFKAFLQDEQQHHRDADDRVRAVEVQVAAVGQQVAAVGMQLAPLQEQVKQHHKSIYGNGEPGMDEQIRQIFAWMQEQRTQKASWQAEAAKYLFWAVTFIGGQLLIRALWGG